MGLIRSLIKEVTGTGSTEQQSSQSRSRRNSESDYDGTQAATTSSSRRKSDSGDGIVRGTIKYGIDKVTGAKPPQYRQDRVDGERVATPEEVTKALELVTSACGDLQQAVDGLKKRGGLVGAVKAGAAMASSSSSDVPSTNSGATTAAAASNPATAKQTSLPAPGAKGSSTAGGQDALLTAEAAAAPTQSGWAKTGEVLKTIGHDGRIPADKLILDAHNKYEAAADLVDGMPEIVMAESNAPALGKLAAPLGGAAQVAMLAVGTGAMAFGVITRIVKRKRTKKATVSVEDMLAEYQAVRLQLESLNRTGRGGMLNVYTAATVSPPQQYGTRPPVHPPQPTPQYSGGGGYAAPAVGVPVGGAPVPQYGNAPAAQQYPQYGAPPPQQYQQYGAPPPQQYPPQYLQQQYGAPQQQRNAIPDLL